MRKEANQVQVQGPAVQELENKGSCLKRSCGKGCFFIILIIIGFLGMIKFISSPQLKELKQVPPSMPDDIPVYEQENANRIAVSTKDKHTFLAKLSDIVPKFFIVSSYLALDSQEQLKNYLDVKESLRNKSSFSKFLFLMKQSPKKQEDKVVIEWKNLKAEPDFIKEFYVNKLESSKYNVDITADTNQAKQISFTKGNIVGNLFIDDDPNDPGTTSVSLNVVKSR